MNHTLIVRLLTYLIFRFLHLLLLLESDIYALLLRLFDKKNADNEVEILNIIGRFRFDSTDVTRESDFLSFHEKTTLFEEICEEGWFIYNITERYLYLVKIRPIDVDTNFESTISVEKCSKLSHFLFQNAEKLARCQVDTFLLISKSIPPFKSKVFIFHSVPASGGTTVAKMIQSCDKSKMSLLVIGEPPFLTSLSLLYNKLSVEVLRNLCKSTLRFSLLHQKDQQTIVLKSRSPAIKLVPFIHSATPSIQHLFISRKNLCHVISRLLLVTSSELNTSIFEILLKLNEFGISSIFSAWRELELEVFTRIGPRNDMEFAMSQVYGAFLNFHRNRSYFVKDVPIIDELICDTAFAMRPILELCEISDLVIPECIEWKRQNEQSIQQIWDTGELSSDDMARIKHLRDLLRQDVFSF